MEYEQLEREEGHQNSFRSESALPTFHLCKFVYLMWTSSETLIFTGKTDRSKNSPTCENAVAQTHGSWMGSCPW